MQVYVSYYDEGYCLAQNVTYGHRVDVPGRAPAGAGAGVAALPHRGRPHRRGRTAPEEVYPRGWCLSASHDTRLPFYIFTNPPCHPADNFNYCSVPLTGQDAFLFAGLALLVASVCMGKLSAIWMLVAGGRGSPSKARAACWLSEPAGWRGVAAGACWASAASAALPLASPGRGCTSFAGPGSCCERCPCSHLPNAPTRRRRNIRHRQL